MFPTAMKTRFNPSLKFIKDLVGPWPIYPLPITITFALASQYAVTKVLDSEDAVLFRIWFKELPNTLFYGTILYLTLISLEWFFNRIKFDRSEFKKYLFSLLLTGITFELIHQIFVDNSTRQISTYFIRNSIALVILCGIFGKNSQLLQTEIAEKSEALDLLEEQRELIIEADEKARREVANFLHDNVQANLVVLAIELRKIAAIVDPPHNQEINSVIEEIDDLRSLDVRQASRKLSPDIATIGIAATLEELSLEYREALDISIEVASPNIPNDLALGIYRITEQALLNAALHGQATRCSVKVISNTNYDAVLTVTNNGLPVPEYRTSGTGSAVIESWVQKFQGRWTLQSNSGETVLTAIFPSTK